METESFAEGIKELIDIALQKRTAYMCSEAVWWRCHRSMVSDYLKADGWEVQHIMGLEKESEHLLLLAHLLLESQKEGLFVNLL